jgi:hypothetical protein
VKRGVWRIGLPIASDSRLWEHGAMLPPTLIGLLLAAAQPAPDAAITVEASRITPEQARDASTEYARAGLPPNPNYGQYARWQGSICASVRGIPDPAVAALVLARMTAAVAQTGLQAGKPGCKPNLTIAFTDDARGLVAQVKSKRRSALPRFDPVLFSRLDSPTLPVRWWHVLAPAGPSGGASTADAGALASASSNAMPLGNVLPAGPDAIGTNSWNSSLVDTNLSIWARAGVAVVDVNLANGVSLEALADYIALVMLAPMRLPPDAPGVPSVLSLFDGSSKPTGLSQWDRAFLKGLYAMQMNRSAQRQRQQLISAMARELAAEPK